MKKTEKITLAFDVYGTLINTHGVLVLLESMIGEKANVFSNLWREKQLEYSFRKGLMDAYEHFGLCTAQALDYADAFLQTNLSASQKQTLLNQYKILPAFDDVIAGLDNIDKERFNLYAFSNGLYDSVNQLLEQAKISQHFDGVVSVDPLKTFKPNPKVYQYFLDQSNSQAKQTWLISSNNFDVLGALNYGLNSVWVKRSAQQVFDFWSKSPTLTLDDLTDLGSNIIQYTEQS
ncbi:haloacid dehalogenase type II [Sessilibacter sp. MAH2]